MVETVYCIVLAMVAVAILSTVVIVWLLVAVILRTFVIVWLLVVEILSTVVIAWLLVAVEVLYILPISSYTTAYY